LPYVFLIFVLLHSYWCILMYRDGRLLPALRAPGRLDFETDARTLHLSEVELRCRLRRNSRTADWAYRTARPILMKRGPVPLSRDLASQEIETPSSLATCAVCRSVSISLVLGELMAHLLSLLEMDRRCLRSFRKK